MPEPYTHNTGLEVLSVKIDGLMLLLNERHEHALRDDNDMRKQLADLYEKYNKLTEIVNVRSSDVFVHAAEIRGIKNEGQNQRNEKGTWESDRRWMLYGAPAMVVSILALFLALLYKLFT